MLPRRHGEPDVGLPQLQAQLGIKLASELQLAFRRRRAIAIEPLEWLQVGRAGALEPPRLRGVFEIVVSAHRPRVRCGLVDHAAKLPFVRR